MQIDIQSIHAFVVTLGIAPFVTWNWVETRSRNSRAVPVTAAVTSEPQLGVEHEQCKIRWITEVERAGFHFDYRYQVAGTTYSGSGFQVEKPGASTTVYYDSADPPRSVAELKDGSLQLVFMIVLGTGGRLHVDQCVVACAPSSAMNTQSGARRTAVGVLKAQFSASSLPT